MTLHRPTDLQRVTISGPTMNGPAVHRGMVNGRAAAHLLTRDEARRIAANKPFDLGQSLPNAIPRLFALTASTHVVSTGERR